jgi:hypothetical protein
MPAHRDLLDDAVGTRPPSCRCWRTFCRRAADVERLFDEPLDPDVITPEI